MKITKQELKEIIEEVATELGLLEGLTTAQEKLPEPLKAAILKKQESDGDDAEEEAIEEGNAFGDAVRKARENGDDEFEVDGKKYPVKEKVTEEVEDTEEFTGEDEDEVEEGNAFGDAVRKAKADGEDEFEVDGKTYQVTESDHDEDEVEEGNAFGDAVRKAKADGEDEFEVDGKTYQVKEVDSHSFKNTTLSETLARIQGNKKVL